MQIERYYLHFHNSYGLNVCSCVCNAIGPDPSLDTVGDTLKLKKRREEKRLLGDDVYEDDEPDDDGFDMLDNQAIDKVID